MNRFAHAISLAAIAATSMLFCAPAGAIVFGETFNCPNNVVLGPVTINANSLSDPIDLTPNVAGGTELPTNQTTIINNPASANGTFTGTLSCTYTIGGVTVPFSRSLSLVVTNANQGVLTTGAVSFNVPGVAVPGLPGTYVITVIAPAENTLGFDRNLIVGGVIVVPLATVTAITLIVPTVAASIPLPLADWLPAALAAIILVAVGWSRRRRA